MSDKLAIKLPTLPQHIEVAEEWVKERDTLTAEAASLKTIETSDDADRAGAILGRITKTSNALETIRKKIAEPYRKADKAIKAAADKAREPLEEEKSRIKGMMALYAEVELAKHRERLRIEEEARRAEAERLLAAQREQMEAADDLGLDYEPEEVDVPAVVHAEFKAAPSSVRMSEVIVWQITNEDEVPRWACSPDSRKINEFVRTHKAELMNCLGNGEATGIKGISFKIETKIQSK